MNASPRAPTRGLLLFWEATSKFTRAFCPKVPLLRKRQNVPLEWEKKSRASRLGEPDATRGAEGCCLRKLDSDESVDDVLQADDLLAKYLDETAERVVLASEIRERIRSCAKSAGVRVDKWTVAVETTLGHGKSLRPG
jgi:hypothetical protein